ncbi:hypothetical protein BDB00DRAFT_850854 [Zychaea mexicana]|uniref:uncharacterized protein n=1 Tax=Zychaea mexicana TaxID=64656 RepID=UPI0022FE20A8|nr:uncharacterized protein BDB00DRAFT_850854 [Zychaea mexicana]KAI9487961.1 hypothetical protein BDB00DRAFT_850854 [Zychaea mexicana]
MPGDIDFDSFDFLNDSALFGQIMFDASRPSAAPPSIANSFAYPTMQSYVPDPNAPAQSALVSPHSYSNGASPTAPPQSYSIGASPTTAQTWNT